MNIMAQSTMTAGSIGHATITVNTMGLSTTSVDSVGQPSTTVESIGLFSTSVDSISQSSTDSSSQTSITVNNNGQSTSTRDSGHSSLTVDSIGQSPTTTDFNGQSCSTMYIIEPSFITKDILVQLSSKGDIKEPSTSVDIMKQSSSTARPTSCLDSSTSTSLDTEILSSEVKNYLKVNQIQWGRFSKLVLGVTPSRLSTLLNKPKPFNSLSRRVQAYYERMSLWMTTRATYGGNPYVKSKSLSLKKGKVVAPKKPRSFLDDDENVEMLNILKEYNESKYMLHAENGEYISDQGLSTMQWQDDSLQKVIVECIPMETTNEEYEEVFTAQIAANQEFGLEEINQSQINEVTNENNVVVNPFGDQGDNRDDMQTELPIINSAPVQGSMMGNLEGNEQTGVVEML